MKTMHAEVIREDEIKSLGIKPSDCVQWVKESFLMKYEAQLPAKISVHPQGNDFFTAMPVLLPERFGKYSVKVVSRIKGRRPALSSEIYLYDSTAGSLLAVLDGEWITTMRTGAVAALACSEFARRDARVYSFIGLGNTAHATALCLTEMLGDREVTFRLLKWKDQAEKFAERFSSYDNISFEFVDNAAELIDGADVIISCITDADGLICPDDSLFRPGCLLVPVHTRGFQNCDLFFDKIFGDDRGHICGFGNFTQFKSFDEFSNVLLGRCPGRENDSERIISYNIGLGLHDAVFADKIHSLLSNRPHEGFTLLKEDAKMWI